VDMGKGFLGRGGIAMILECTGEKLERDSSRAPDGGWGGK